MYTAAGLMDLHERGHRTLRLLLSHCSQLTSEEFNRELSGFGYPSVRQQLEHIIGAEEYWVSVIMGSYKDEVAEPNCATVDALETYRARVEATTKDYLRQVSEEELNKSSQMWTWPGKARSLIPALVVLRFLTHIYTHQGQVLAMSRQMGKPSSGGMDFPID